MNTIKVYLAESGRIADLKKDFPLYQGSYQNKLLNVYVPTSILAPEYTVTNANGAVTADFVAGTAVKIGMQSLTRDGSIRTSQTRYMRFLKTLTYNNVEYALYERKLPKEFTLYAGQGANAPTLIINVVNIQTDSMNGGEPTVLSIITTQSAKLDVMPSADLDGDEVMEPSELDTVNARLNAIEESLVEKQNITDKALETANKTVVGAINENKGKIDTNTANIAVNTENITKAQNDIEYLNNHLAQPEEYIGQLTGATLPTDEQLNSFVYNNTTPSREPKNADVVIFILEVAGKTDKNYKYIYSVDGWNGYEIPPMEEASNGSLGIIEGTYQTGVDNDTIVDIVNGQIKNIFVKDNSGTYRNIVEYLNTEAVGIDNTIGQVLELGLTGVIESGRVVFTVENAESYIDYRTNLREFLVTALLPVVGELDPTLPVNITFGDTTYNVYNYLTGGNTPVTIGSLVSIRDYNTDKGYEFNGKLLFLQNSTFTGFIIVPPVITAQQLDNMIIDTETVVTDIDSTGTKVSIHLAAPIVMKLAKTLVTPAAAPVEPKLVGIGTDNMQKMVTAGDGLEIENDTLNVKLTPTLAPFVSYTEAQGLTAEQQAQARANIGAGSATGQVLYSQLIGKPSLNTANAESIAENPSETIEGTINLHRVSKTGKLADAIDDDNHTTVTKAEQTQIATNAASISDLDADVKNLNNELDNYLPKAGGTLTGDVSSSASISAENLIGNSVKLVGNVATMGENYFIVTDENGNMKKRATGQVLDDIGGTAVMVDGIRVSDFNADGKVNKSGDTMTGPISAPMVTGSNGVYDGNNRVYSAGNLPSKLNTNATIDGIKFDGSTSIVHYGIAEGDAALNAKTVAISNFSLVTGARIAVKFKYANQAYNPTLNVNNTGAKPIYFPYSEDLMKEYFTTNKVFEFIYDGTNWVLISGDPLSAYPIGSIYITVNSRSPAGLFGGSWEQISANRVLWSVTNSGLAGAYSDAGLPNITGTWERGNGTTEITADTARVTGCFAATGVLTNLSTGKSYGNSSGNYSGYTQLTFLASKSNSIYGNSTTVRPPAYTVLMWRRIA